MESLIIQFQQRQPISQKVEIAKRILENKKGLTTGEIQFFKQYIDIFSTEDNFEIIPAYSSQIQIF